jgi:hypothetical protein
LRRLKEQGRLLWYNCSTSRDHRPGSPVVSARYFSAEGALNLLAAAGACTVRSLGLDGGKQYSETFKDLSYRLLVNRQPSFDLQFSEFARTILTTGIDFAPLDAEVPIQLFVESSARETLPRSVLEYSVRKRTSMTVSIVSSEHRISEASGRVFRLKADMQVLQDLRPFWLAKTKPQVLIDDYKEGDTPILRYGDKSTQPWLSTDNALGYIWGADFLEAISTGFISANLVKEEVELGHVRQSLLWQLEHQVPDPLFVPRCVRARDKLRVPIVGLARRKQLAVWLHRFCRTMRARFARVRARLRTVGRQIP